MLWRVQSAWSGGIHTGFAGIEEHLAKRDVARLLGQWTVVNLDKFLEILPTINPGHHAFIMEATLLRASILDYLSRDEVWQAYDMLHEFQEKFNEVFKSPLWVNMGTVIVEAPPGKGPQTRKTFITVDDFPEEYRPDLGTSTPGHSLGANLRRWRITSRNLGVQETAVFLKEQEAMNHLGRLMETLARKLHAHASGEAIAKVNADRTHYADEAIQVVFQITDLARSGQPIIALDRWHRFASSYADLFLRPTLDMLVGDVAVTVDGVPMSLGALRRWIVAVQLPGEAIEQSTHLLEEDALNHAVRSLNSLLDRAIFQAEVWQAALYRRPDDYLVNLQGAIDFTLDKIQRGAYREAVDSWLGFQAYDSTFESEQNLVGPPPVGPLIGRLMVEAT